MLSSIHAVSTFKGEKKGLVMKENYNAMMGSTPYERCSEHGNANGEVISVAESNTR